jgi:glycosyltransferase involved in cell wall biosynthesis
MFISVGIPTYNRADLLDQTLQKMCDLFIPDGVEWELLIVNNNCTDHTDHIIEKYKSQLPIKHLHEKNPGRSHALNTAVELVNGEYIIWTDDDSLVDVNWIENYVKAFRLWPDTSMFYGPVKPHFEGNPPKWMSVVLKTIPFVYALLDFGTDSFELSEDKMPFGVNLAIRARDQKQYCYDTSLGRKPNSFLGGEEIELVQKMLADGKKGRWIPAALVHHYIPQDRQTIRYLRKYCRGWGEYEARDESHSRGRQFLGKPIWRWRMALMKEIKYRIKKILYKPEFWMEDLISSSKDWGRLVGSSQRPFLSFMNMLTSGENKS